jgi:hypothetical protein
MVSWDPRMVSSPGYSFFSHRKSVRATRPEAVYSQPAPITCSAGPAGTAWAAAPKPKPVHRLGGRDRPNDHRGASLLDSRSKLLAPGVWQSHGSTNRKRFLERYPRALQKSVRYRSADGLPEESPARQQQTAHGSMRLVKCAPNLMQRLSRLPAAPDVALLDRRNPKSFSRSHTTPPLKNRLITNGVASTC